MNAKIKKLAKQAGMVEYPAGLGMTVNTIWGDQNIEKFSKLILTEVVDILSSYRAKVIFEDGAEYNYEHPIYAISKYFGIKS